MQLQWVSVYMCAHQRLLGGASEATPCPWFPSSMVAQRIHPEEICLA